MLGFKLNYICKQVPGLTHNSAITEVNHRSRIEPQITPDSCPTWVDYMIFIGSTSPCYEKYALYRIRISQVFRNIYAQNTPCKLDIISKKKVIVWVQFQTFAQYLPLPYATKYHILECDLIRVLWIHDKVPTTCPLYQHQWFFLPAWINDNIYHIVWKNYSQTFKVCSR